MAPLDTTHAVRKNIGAIRFVPPHYVATLFAELPQVTEHETRSKKSHTTQLKDNA